MTMLPTLNTTDWTVLDFELAYAGLHALSDASRMIQNQPRAYNSNAGDYWPGAGFIVDIGEGWCSARIDELMERLRLVRFDDPKHDERRVLLLLNYASSHGSASDSLASIVQLALDQSVRPTA